MPYWKETGNFLGIRQVRSLLFFFCSSFESFSEIIRLFAHAYASIDEHVRCAMHRIAEWKKKWNKTKQMHVGNLRERKRNGWTNLDGMKINLKENRVTIRRRIMHRDTQNKSLECTYIQIEQNENDRSIHANWNCNRANTIRIDRLQIGPSALPFHHLPSICGIVFFVDVYRTDMPFAPALHTIITQKKLNPSKNSWTVYFSSKPPVAFLSNEHTNWEVIRKRQRIVKSCFMQISFFCAQAFFVSVAGLPQKLPI